MVTTLRGLALHVHSQDTATTSTGVPEIASPLRLLRRETIRNLSSGFPCDTRNTHTDGLCFASNEWKMLQGRKQPIGLMPASGMAMLVMAFVFSLPLIALPVGELSEITEEGKSLSGLAGFSVILSALNQMQTNGRVKAEKPRIPKVAGEQLIARPVPAAERSFKDGESQGDKAKSAPLSSSFGDLKSSPPVPIELGSSDDSAPSARGEASMGSFSQPSVSVQPAPVSRGPAVLPLDDPSLTGFSSSQTTFGNRGEWSMANKVSQLVALRSLELGKKDKQEDKDTKDENKINEKKPLPEKDRVALEKEIRGLQKRPKPYKFRDYVDFREFIAANKAPNRDGFKMKATEIFKEFADRDNKMRTARKKAKFEEFVKPTMQDPDGTYQNLLEPNPMRHEAMPQPVALPPDAH